MRKMGAVMASMAVAGGLLLLGFYAGITDAVREAKAQTLPSRPNMVFILVDDMRRDDLKYMPKTMALLKDEGMTFQNAFVSNALCAPSRATIMRGQYSHNNGVWSNSFDSGGWQAYQQNGNEEDNVATRLQGAGYRTGLFGKYLNGYTRTTYIPHQQGRSAEWDRWFAPFVGGGYPYFDYGVNDQGTIRHFGTQDSDYITDVLSRKTDAFLKNSAAQNRPFFAYVAPTAPHGPATPAPRDVHAFDGATAPRLPSFNEKEVSDKPSWISTQPRLTSSQISDINTRHEDRIESLQAVDDLVEGVVDTLGSSSPQNGVVPLDNTYIFFTSDNGWHHGEHRIPGEKWRPYEEDVHMPLLVRGPGVAAGSTTYKMALNTDYLPTFTDLAGAQSPPYVDGRSLEPVIHGGVTSRRSAILLEAAAHFSPAYEGVRTAGKDRSKYVAYAEGTRELYDLGSDPYELANAYVPGGPPPDLADRLPELKDCSAATTLTCQAAEDGP